MGYFSRGMGRTFGFRAARPSRINPEVGLTLSGSHAVGRIAATEFAKSSPAVFGCELVFPAAPSEDFCLFELGGSGVGAAVGYAQALDVLFIRWGDGSTTNAAPGTACVFGSVSYGAVAGKGGRAVWEFDTAARRVRLWFNGVLLIDATQALASTTWAGSADGGYDAVFDTVASGYITTGGVLRTDVGCGSTASDLRYYSNQLVTAL